MLNSTNPIIKFERNSIKFYITPVLVCKMPLKTVGLGDAISSTGLFYSLFNNNAFKNH
jgi:ADP-dependent glucokinase